MKTTEFGMFAHAPMSGEAAAYLPKRATRPGFLRPGSRSYGLLAAAGLGALSLLDPSEGDARERRTVNRIIAAATGVYGAAELRAAMDVGALAAGVTPRGALRVKGTDAAARGLPDADDEAILAAMVENPVLVERPFVCGPGGVRLCRPAELVRETLSRQAFP